MSHPVYLHGWSAPTPGRRTLQLSSSARADDLNAVGVAPHFEALSLRMMLFLVPTFFSVFSICSLYDNVRSSVTPRYTGRLE